MPYVNDSEQFNGMLNFMKENVSKVYIKQALHLKQTSDKILILKILEIISSVWPCFCGYQLAYSFMACTTTAHTAFKHQLSLLYYCVLPLIWSNFRMVERTKPSDKNSLLNIASLLFHSELDCNCNKNGNEVTQCTAYSY